MINDNEKLAINELTKMLFKNRRTTLDDTSKLARDEALLAVVNKTEEHEYVSNNVYLCRKRI